MADPRDPLRLPPLNYASDPDPPPAPVPFAERAERAKNWRLEGTGFNPISIYGSLFIILGLWVLGAWVLSWFGPIGAMILTVGVTTSAYFFSYHRDMMRQTRIGMGCCPKCGYDLRATDDKCPECGTDVPEEILRRRRLAAPPPVPLAPPPRPPLPPMIEEP